MSEKVTHTPRPWHSCPAAEFDKMNGGPTGHDAMTAIYVPPGKCEHEGDSDDWPQLIAYVDGWRGDDHLVKAAPDLLAALEGVLRVADRATDEFDLARAAIRKAKGES